MFKKCIYDCCNVNFECADNSRAKYCLEHRIISRKRKKSNVALWIEKYGKEEAEKRLNILKDKVSKKNSGKNNGMYGKKQSKKTREKRSITIASKIANGEFKHKANNFKKGWYFSEKMKEKFWYDSSWEYLRMQILDIDENVISWTKRHGIRIQYKDKNIIRNYIPDFLINGNTIEEIKGNFNNKKNLKLKIKALKKYCKIHNFKYNLVYDKDLKILCENFLRENFKNYIFKLKNNILHVPKMGVEPTNNITTFLA